MEIWKDIPGFESRYQVSNLGEIRSILHNNMYGPIYRIKKIKGRDNGKGYFSVSLKYGNKFKNFYIHRLVVKTFIENVENKLEVNHINGIKNDNRLENLEYCTRSENIRHSINTLGKNLGKRKMVVIIDNLGNEILFHSRKECGSFLKVTGEAIQYAIKNGKKCKGFLCFNIPLQNEHFLNID